MYIDNNIGCIIIPGIFPFPDKQTNGSLELRITRSFSSIGTERACNARCLKPNSGLVANGISANWIRIAGYRLASLNIHRYIPVRAGFSDRTVLHNQTPASPFSSFFIEYAWRRNNRENEFMSMLKIFRVAFAHSFNESSNSRWTLRIRIIRFRISIRGKQLFASFWKGRQLTKLFFYRQKRKEKKGWKFRLTFDPRFQGDMSRTAK